MDIEKVKEFLQSDEGAEIVDELKKPLLNKRDELLSENKTYKERLQKFENVDIEELQNISKEYQKLVKESEKQGDDPETIEALKQTFEEQLSEANSKYEDFVGRYINTLTDNKISNAINKHDGITELCKPFINKRVKTSLNDDQSLNIEILTEDGKPMYVNGKEATLDDLVEDMKNHELYSHLFKAKNSSGIGTRVGKPSGGVITDYNDPNFNLTEAMKLAKR